MVRGPRRIHSPRRPHHLRLRPLARDPLQSPSAGVSKNPQVGRISAHSRPSTTFNHHRLSTRIFLNQPPSFPAGPACRDIGAPAEPVPPPADSAWPCPAPTLHF